MRADADVIVVGGGPVGLATAIRARARGLDVIVVEPRTTPIDKACGEGLLPGALAALTALGVPGPGAPALEGHDIVGIGYLDGRTRVEHRFAAGLGRGIRRPVLQAALAERAAGLGADLVEGRLEGLEQDAGGVTILLADGGRLRADWLVACDGLHSRVRRLAGLEGRGQPVGARRFGLRRHYEVTPWSDLVEVHWAPHAEAYVTPVGAGLVGVALLGGRLERGGRLEGGGDFEDRVAAFPLLADQLQGARPAGEVRGAGPLRQRSRARVAGRVLLAGDAADYVDALTGEGLRIGFAQADAAIAAIARGEPRSYEAAWSAGTRQMRRLTAGLVAAARSPARSRIVPVAARHPRLFGAIVERLAR
ncbi:FAD-dependent monooxygenase [Microbacterium sp. STN6]|uniref:NAD(P)/FAD-dependent oxidoreductase n=1 Tax=Microbacterium sp. STN6 TaxID=2995588 RepID=UPI002260E9D7|nr:FAD-dependent oxidoreductase [Microbacterium sp. STN6]MCX7522689.1 FAD-dependent monooxygenase [Microbacterium sp. STN6]